MSDIEDMLQFLHDHPAAELLGDEKMVEVAEGVGLRVRTSSGMPPGTLVAIDQRAFDPRMPEPELPKLVDHRWIAMIRNIRMPEPVQGS